MSNEGALSDSDDPRDDPGWVATQPSEEMLAAMREGMDRAIETAGPDFGEALRNLDAAVSRVQPFDLICTVALYFLTVEAGTNPEFNRPEGIFQHHAELIFG